MQLTREYIKGFQDLHERKFGQKLSWEEASDAAYRLIGFFELSMKLDAKQKRNEREQTTP